MARGSILRWRIAWVARRNRILASARFQTLAARMPGIRRVARNRAGGLFDLVAGFSYSQILFAVVELDLLGVLASGPTETGDVARKTGLGDPAAERLLRAARGLDVVEEVAPGLWMLGQQGAVLHANSGAVAMIRHHRLLYADLADPVALLRADRAEANELSRFWTYAGDRGDAPQSATPYSELMAASQKMVSEQATEAYDFGRHRGILDIGGGHGRFAQHLAAIYPHLEIGIFDLPEVIAGMSTPAPGTRAHAGDFFADPIPGGYDCHTLVRILHDHDDEAAARLLRASRAALPPGGRLVIVEPMGGEQATGGLAAYFEMYLWAMGSGRPRTAREIGAMLTAAGFGRWRRIETAQPVVTSLIVAHV